MYINMSEFWANLLQFIKSVSISLVPIFILSAQLDEAPPGNIFISSSFPALILGAILLFHYSTMTYPFVVFFKYDWLFKVNVTNYEVTNWEKHIWGVQVYE